MKKEHRRIYEELLKELKSSSSQRFGFCTSFCIALGNVNIHDLPELMAYKPNRTYRISGKRWRSTAQGNSTGWWWSPYNRKIRIKVLEEILAK